MSVGQEIGNDAAPTHKTLKIGFDRFDVTRENSIFFKLKNTDVSFKIFPKLLYR